MKFAVSAFIVVLSLVAVSAKATGTVMTDYEDIQQYESTAIKGIKCVFEEIRKIKDVSQKFLADIAACRSKANERVQALADAVKDIIKTCDEIIEIYETVCKNGKKTDLICTTRMMKKVAQLGVQVASAVKLIIDIQNIPGDTNKCVLDAIHSLGKYFTEFPANVKACSN